MKKGGVSIVVASVLLILITIVAITLIASFIIPFVKNNLYHSTMCLPYRGYFSFQQTYEYKGSQIHYNCYKNSGYGVALTAKSLTQNSAEHITGFILTFSNETSSIGVRVLKNMSTSDMLGGIRMLNPNEKEVIIPGSDGLETYVYNGTKGFDTVAVEPLLASGSVCAETDSIKLEPCDSSLSFTT